MAIVVVIFHKVIISVKTLQVALNSGEKWAIMIRMAIFLRQHQNVVPWHIMKLAQQIQGKKLV